MLRCAITDGRLDQRSGPQDRARLAARCAAVAAAGADFLIVREKALDAGALMALCREISGVAGGTAIRVLVSGRADVASAAGLAGVHLSARPGELTPAQVRRVLPGAFVSVSCHTADEVARAREIGADMALFAPVFGKVSAGLPGVGLAALAAACAVAGGMPVLALGGVDAGNAEQCVQAGAAGVAGIRLFFAG